MRFRPANIRLINRRSILTRLLLALSSKEETNNDKNNPTNVQRLTESLHIRWLLLAMPPQKTATLDVRYGTDESREKRANAVSSVNRSG